MRAGRVIETMPDFYLEDLAPAAFFFETLAAVSCAFLFCLATFAAGAAAVVAATAGPARTLRATNEVIRVRFILGSPLILLGFRAHRELGRAASHPHVGRIKSCSSARCGRPFRARLAALRLAQE